VEPLLFVSDLFLPMVFVGLCVGTRSMLCLRDVNY
jgi:hypothetical protein